MDKYLNDNTKIVKYYYISFSMAIINFILIMLMIFLGLFSLAIPLIILGFIFIIFTVVLIKIHFDAKKYAKKMDGYYTIYFDKKYCYDEIISLIENSSFIKDTYKYYDKGNLFYYDGKVASRILVLNMDLFNKKDYDSVKIKVNREYNKKSNYRVRRCYNGRRLISKFFRVNIICLDKENEDIYKYLSNNIYTSLSKVEGTLNIAIINNKIIIPSINNAYLWDDYSVIKYKIMLDFLFEVLSIDCCR